MEGERKLRVRDVETHPVVVPLSRPIRTASGTIADAPLLLIDLHTDEGVTGRSYLFGYQPLTLRPLAALVQSMAAMIRGDLVAPSTSGSPADRPGTGLAWDDAAVRRYRVA